MNTLFVLRVSRLTHRALRFSLLAVLFCAGVAHAQSGPGHALGFSGNGSYVAVPHTAGLNAFPLTVMAWVNTTAATGQQGLVNKYLASSFNGWNLFLRDGRVRAWYFVNNTRFVWDGTDGLDGGPVADGAWHHIAFTVDASGGKLYVDGVVRASRAWTGAAGAPTTTQEVRLGNYPGGVLSFNGPLSLDEITVWNVALSQSQIVSYLFTPLSGSEANLLALYRGEEGSGVTVADSAPLNGNNHGTWVGTPAFVPTIVAPQALSEGGASRGDCRGTPGITEVKLDWRGQNVAGCKVDLDWSRSRIRRVASDCSTIYYADLPSETPRRWTLLSQPIGSDIGIEVTATSVRLPMPVPGNYTVELEVCPGDCVVPGPDGNTFPMVPSKAIITIRAEAELPLRVQERPVLPPSAMVPAPRLDLSDSQRDCMCQGGGGFSHPQWVTVSPWAGANDYKLVEGSVVAAWPSTRASLLNHDLAFNGGDWYVINDVAMTVSPDPRYHDLLSMKPESQANPHLLTCEAQYDTVPDRFCLVEGDRVSLWGFWVLDCGREPFYTAIHPAVGWAVHRNRPVRIPDNATFTFDLVTNMVTSTAGNNLYVPGVVSDLWFNSDTGGATGGDPSSLAQPAQSPSCVGGANITQSPIQREYDFNIYLPKNPSQVFAEVGITKPRAPLHVSISNPSGSPGPDPTFSRVTETVNGVAYEFLRVHLDLRGHSHSNYSRRIEAAWVYPKADNWGLEQWRVTLDKLDVYDDLDSKLRFPGSDGDWVLWMMLPGADQSWTRIRDGINNTHGTVTFDPPWQTGSADPVIHRAPLALDPQRRLGPDVLTFNRSVSFWLGGFEADEAGDPDAGGEVGGDAGDPGRISGVVFNSGQSNVLHSHNDVFSATVTGTRVAIHSNGVLTAAATQLSRHYLLNCTNRLNNRNPIRESINPFDTPGLLLEGISGEPPWSPVDPQQIYGGGAALLGDVNGDGFPDVALGTHSNAQAHIFLGGRNGFAPAPFAIASVSQGDDRPVKVDKATFVGASDLNDDGIPDLLIGAPTFNVHSNFLNIHSNAGAVFAFSGAQLRTGGSFAHSNALWSVGGSHSNAQFGFAVAAGDINRDGISDVVIGAPFHSNVVTAGRPLGRVFVYFGSPLIHSNKTPSQVVIPPLLDTISDHWFGYSVSMAGDVNRDGYTDVVIGAPRYTRTFQRQGACFLFYGSPTGLVLNTSLRIEGFDFNAQFGFSVAGAGDVDGDTFPDILVGAPFSSGSELTLQNGYAALYRGSAGGLIPTAAWLKYGETGGIHTGADVGPVGDLNGDGRADIAIGTPDETSPEGLRGRVTYFLGNSNPSSLTETWPVRGVNGIAKLMINSPCCVPFISACCNTGTTNKVDINLDGFADALTFSSLTHSTRVDRVRLVLGRGQRLVLPQTETFFRAGASSPFAFQSILHSNFVANLTASGQTEQTIHSNLLARVQNLFATVQQSGGDVGGILPLLQRLQNVHSNLVNLGFVHSNLFNQFFASVDLDLGTAFYIDCGATSEYTDALGRRWLPDAPFLATPNAPLTVFTIGAITNTLTGDRYLPDAMLNSERWFNGHLRYQVGVPNGWYTVLLYFSENYPPAVNPALGGTGGASFARLFDLEVEGQRVSAYNQADAALPPNGDGFGRLYTATQVPFAVQVTDGLLDIAVLDRGPGNPPENAAIKGFAILGRPDPATKFATRPRIASTSRDAGQLSLGVDLQATLARYLAGEIPLRLQSSSNLAQWATLSLLPEVSANGAFFSMPTPTNNSGFYRAVVLAP